MPCDQTAASVRRERVGPRWVKEMQAEEEDAGADFSDAEDFSDFLDSSDVADDGNETEGDAGGVEAGSKPRGMRRKCNAMIKWPGVRRPCMPVSGADTDFSVETLSPVAPGPRADSGSDRRRRMTSRIRA